MFEVISSIPQFRLFILFHCADHFVYVAVWVYYDGFSFAWSYIAETFDVGFIFLLYDFVPFYSFLIGEVASVLCHNFIIWIYGFFRILFPFCIENIGLCEFKYCYLIMLCLRVRKPSFECVTIFFWQSGMFWVNNKWKTAPICAVYANRYSLKLLCNYASYILHQKRNNTKNVRPIIINTRIFNLKR